MFPNATDPWSETVDLLKVLSGCSDRCSQTLHALSGRAQAERRSHHDWTEAKVSITGRPSLTTVTLLWSQSNCCFYGDQLWHFGFARRPGRCALSGRPIARGAGIYRPRRGVCVPANASAMILASLIEGVFAAGALNEELA
jgi:hypothetical protein